MKQQDVTNLEKLGELILDAQHPNSAGRVFICVEGESDIRFFRKFFDLNVCRVEAIPGGNPKVEACTAELAKRNKLVFGIRDADFLRLDETGYVIPYMFLTDCHDMEMGMVADDDVFAQVLAEYASVTHPISHDRAAQLALRTHLLAVLESVSLLKWLNAQQAMSLAFAGVGFLDLLEFEQGQLKQADWWQRLAHKSHEAEMPDEAILAQQLQQLGETEPDAFQISNGHDFLAVLTEYIRRQKWEKGLNVHAVARVFRSSFTFIHWQKTELYQQTQQWADQHQCRIYRTHPTNQPERTP